MFIFFMSPLQIIGTDFYVFHVNRVGAQATSFTLNAQFQADSTLFLYHRLDLQRQMINCRRFYRVSSEGNWCIGSIACCRFGLSTTGAFVIWVHISYNAH